MPQTIAILLPMLQFAAGAGSGVIASWLFTRIRQALPKDTVVPWLLPILHAPRYARYTVLILSALIAIVASVLVALLTAGDLPAAFDAAFSAALAGIASQVAHGHNYLPDEVTERDGARIYPVQGNAGDRGV